MKNSTEDAFDTQLKSFPSKRLAIKAVAMALILPVPGVGRTQDRMQNGIELDLVMYSYLSRPIYDIIFNRTALGVANKYGGTGILTDVWIPFGRQSLRWNLDGPDGTARNGELVKSKNSLIISAEMIPSSSRYIGLHLYPDDTVEVTFARSIPTVSERGRKIYSDRK